MTTVAPRFERPQVGIGGAGVRPFNWARLWGALGGASVLMAVYVFGSWVGSGDPAATTTGGDPVPGTTKAWIWCYQVAGIIFLVAFAVAIARAWRRDRVITLTGAVFIAWTVCLWVDPATLNFLRTQMLYNSYAVNVGSWGPHIPGWVSPNAGLLPEPLIAYSGVYGAQVILALLAMDVMRRVRRKHPEMGPAGLMLRSLGVLMVVDLVLEVLLIRAEFWAYAGVVQRLSLWGGERYQFPLYEPLFFGGINVLIGAMLFFKDDQGRSFIERGTLFRRQRQAKDVTSTSRILTVTGFVTVVYLGYTALMGFFGLYGGPYPEGYPSYMMNGMCGPGTQYECMAPTVPIPLPDSGPLPPRKDPGG